MHNDVFAVAALTELNANRADAHMLAARYFFAQLWCEFTKEVITEFFSEDISNKMFESEKRKDLSKEESFQKKMFHIRP